jgi:DNA adenine methylase
MANVTVMKLRPLFKNHGGKFYLAPWIINHFPANYEDLNFVETSGGAASVLLNKKPSKIDVYNDLNPKIANIFHTMKYNSEQFINGIININYSEKSFKEALKVPFEYGNIQSAIAELVLRRMSRGGLGKHFSWSKRLRGGRPGDENAWETFKNLLPLINKRLQNVIIECNNQLKTIQNYDSPNTLFYCDPPYVHSTRSAANTYDFEMTDDQHEELGKSLNCIQGKALISGYDCPLYQSMFKNWRCVAKIVKNNAGQTKTKSSRVEVLWLNY